MNNIIEVYIRKILESGCNLQEGDDEIKSYAYKLPEAKDIKRTKIIYVLKESYLAYYKRLCDEYLEKYGVYKKSILFLELIFY